MSSDQTQPTTIDVTGLSPVVIWHLQQLVQLLRTSPSSAPAEPRKSYIGAFEHTRTGSWSAEDFKAARREMFGGTWRDAPEPQPPAEHE